jgi:uncharacterized protein (DUF488 family)
LKEFEINLIVDIRAIPRSRTNPQYNSEPFGEALAELQIGYRHIEALGGLRGQSRTVPADINAYWKNKSFHNYADYAMGEHFHTGLLELRELGRNARCAIMCAEAVWWRCHRRIITDYLIASGEPVFHIFGRNHFEQAHMTSHARSGPNDVLHYPADV